MEIKDRMDEFRASRGLTTAAFEQVLGASNGSWRKKIKISEEIILRFVSVYPEINTDWLIRGKGQMTGNPSISEGDKAVISRIRSVCRSVRKNQRQQQELIDELMNTVGVGE